MYMVRVGIRVRVWVRVSCVCIANSGTAVLFSVSEMDKYT